MQLHYFPSPEEANRLDTEALRSRFLISELFKPGQIAGHYTDLDRMIVGGVMPTTAPLALPMAKELGTTFFLERREIGILNIGAVPASISVDGTKFELPVHACLYVGKGAKDVQFLPTAGDAALVYISTPAHATHPTRLATREQATVAELGTPEGANRRRIVKYIHPDGIASCQLVMGFTEFHPGSVWNTMPPHHHSRRTEIYVYFDLGEQIVVHLMGQPTATRHLIVRNRDAVLSPSWSIHSGAGTGAYRFMWAMGGDNQIFTDMDPVSLKEIR